MTKAPEAFTTQGGTTRSSFTVAVQRRFANAHGVREADFLPVVAWRQTAEFCNKYLDKGRKVCVEGSVQVRSYDAQDGSKRWVTEIIADHVETLDRRQDEQRREDGPQEPPKQQRMDLQPGGEFVEVDNPDDLPF